jgi:hypothetical protein
MYDRFFFQKKISEKNSYGSACYAECHSKTVKILKKVKRVFRGDALEVLKMFKMEGWSLEREGADILNCFVSIKDLEKECTEVYLREILFALENIMCPEQFVLGVYYEFIRNKHVAYSSADNGKIKAFFFKISLANESDSIDKGSCAMLSKILTTIIFEKNLAEDELLVFLDLLDEIFELFLDKLHPKSLLYTEALIFRKFFGIFVTDFLQCFHKSTSHPFRPLLKEKFTGMFKKVSELLIYANETDLDQFCFYQMVVWDQEFFLPFFLEKIRYGIDHNEIQKGGLLTRFRNCLRIILGDPRNSAMVYWIISSMK